MIVAGLLEFCNTLKPLTDTADLQERNVWFHDKEGVALKWHYPIGLLYDLHSKDPITSDSNLPWTIHAKFDSFPTDQLIPFTGTSQQEPSRDQFMATIKQADFIRHGSIKNIMGLTKQDQSTLWDAVSSTHDYDAFQSANHSLVQPASTGSMLPRAIPIRFYRKPSVVIQNLYPPSNSDGTELTIGETVSNLLNPPSDPQCITHGILIDPNTPLSWLSLNASYPDNFLHIVILN